MIFGIFSGVGAFATRVAAGAKSFSRSLGITANSYSPKQFSWQNSPNPAETIKRDVRGMHNKFKKELFSNFAPFEALILRGVKWVKDILRPAEKAYDLFDDGQPLDVQSIKENANKNNNGAEGEGESNESIEKQTQNNLIGGVPADLYHRVYQRLLRKRVKESEAYEALRKKRKADKRQRIAGGIEPINGERVRGLYAVLGGSVVTAKGIAMSPQFKKQIRYERAIGK